MSLMNYIDGMKLPHSLVLPLQRFSRKSLRHNTLSKNAHLDADEARNGYVIVGSRKLPIWRVDSDHLRTSTNYVVVGHTRPGTTGVTVELNHKIIEDLFRETKEGRFDAFSRQLKNVIQQYANHIDFSQESDTAAKADGLSADALAAARQRGVDYALIEWQKPENLMLQATARYAGISDNTVNTCRQNQ